MLPIRYIINIQFGSHHIVHSRMCIHARMSFVSVVLWEWVLCRLSEQSVCLAQKEMCVRSVELLRNFTANYKPAGKGRPAKMVKPQITKLNESGIYPTIFHNDGTNTILIESCLQFKIAQTQYPQNDDCLLFHIVHSQTDPTWSNYFIGFLPMPRLNLSATAAVLCRKEIKIVELNRYGTKHQNNHDWDYLKVTVPSSDTQERGQKKKKVGVSSKNRPK